MHECARANRASDGLYDPQCACRAGRAIYNGGVACAGVDAVCGIFARTWSGKKEVDATSAAMELAAADATIAAIGAPEAAAHYRLRIIDEHVSDKTINTTRFGINTPTATRNIRTAQRHP